jgi:hypothetical protein
MTFVGVWLGVQTGNKRTTREWTRPGNRPTISFWLGEFITTDGSTSLKNGIELRVLHPLFYIRPRSEFLDYPFLKKNKKNGVNTEGTIGGRGGKMFLFAHFPSQTFNFLALKEG